MHRGHDLVVGLWGPVTASTARVGLADQLGAGAQAAGDDDPAVLVQGLADGVQGLLHGASMKPQVLTMTRSAPS
jgi:hypothetical protein